MPMLTKEIKKYLLLTLVAGVFTCANDNSLAETYVYSFEWDYIVLDGKYKVIKQGNIRQELAKSIADLGLNATAQKTSPYHIYPGNEGRIYLAIGQGQEDKFYGVLVIQKQPLKLLHFLPITTNFDVPIRVLDAGKVAYVSWREGSTRKNYAYDTTTFKVVREYTDPLFGISDVTCLIDGKIFNGRLWDPRTGEQVNKSGLPMGTRLYDCSNRYVLGILNKTTAEPAELLVAEITPDAVLKKTIKTDEKITGLNLPQEWYLSKDAKDIIRDDSRIKKGGAGRLVFISVDTGEKKEIKIENISPYARIIGQSSSGQWLYYASEKNLYVIDVKNKVIARKITLPLVPQVVITDD